MQNQHHPDQPPPDFARFIETGQEIDTGYYHDYKAEPIRMLCKLLTVGGDFLVMAKNPTQYKAIARLMQAAFPGVPMRSSFRAVSGANTLILDTKKGTFEVFYIGGPLDTNSVQKPGIVALENEATKESREFWGQLEKDGVTISPSALDSEETAIDLFG